MHRYALGKYSHTNTRVLWWYGSMNLPQLTSAHLASSVGLNRRDEDVPFLRMTFCFVVFWAVPIIFVHSHVRSFAHSHIRTFSTETRLSFAIDSPLVFKVQKEARDPQVTLVPA